MRLASLAPWMASLQAFMKCNASTCPGHLIHLAHLSQVDCQFGSRPKPFQNNKLQFNGGLFSSHLAHFVHAHRRRKLWKNVRAGVTKDGDESSLLLRVLEHPRGLDSF